MRSMLSVVITTWNEERTLPRAVASVQAIAGEIVVVDTESVDNTMAVAKKLGCTVYHHKNTGIVEPVRNFSISKAKGDWILLLDADETVSPALAAKISKLITDPSVDYYRLPRQNMIFGKWIQNSHWWPDYVFRLFKKGSVTWSDEIHSVPFTKGSGQDLPVDPDVAIVHHHYATISQFVIRLNRYTDHLLNHLQKSGYKFVWSDVITKPFDQFLTLYFARGGYKDGLHGLALALLLSFQELVLYLKAWEQTKFTPEELTQDQVHRVISVKFQEYNWWRGDLWSRIKRKLGL